MDCLWPERTFRERTFWTLFSFPPSPLTFCVQHFGDVQVFLSHVEGCVQVGHGIVLLTTDTEDNFTDQLFPQFPLFDTGYNEDLTLTNLAKFSIVDELRTMSVNERTETQTILPAARREHSRWGWCEGNDEFVQMKRRHVKVNIVTETGLKCAKLQSSVRLNDTLPWNQWWCVCSDIRHIFSSAFSPPLISNLEAESSCCLFSVSLLQDVAQLSTPQITHFGYLDV